MNPITDEEDIEVAVDFGKVILSGTVSSHLERTEAERLAAKAAGVTRIENRLRFDRAAVSPAPYHYGPDFPAITGTVDRAMFPVSDREIHDAIRTELTWDPFVDTEQIDIDVEGGRVTLRGTVDTWREYTAAAENAYEGGAVTLDNRLQVE